LIANAVEVGFFQADVFAANALDLRVGSRGDQYARKMVAGRVWRMEDGRELDEGRKIWDLASGELKISLTAHISTVRGFAPPVSLLLR
jgi:hypothetical protein